jgi:MoaA/NifB/PqqE/SkfB family radical SAM enzyme
MFTNIFFSKTHTLINTGTRCSMDCSFCRIKNSDKVAPDFRFLIESGTFFSVYKRSRWVSLFGGDPFDHPDFFLVLVFLKSHRINICVWTHGIVPLDILEKVTPYVDEWCVYCPTVDPEVFPIILGNGTFEEFSESMECLKESARCIRIHTPVIDDNIGELPAIHEWVKHHQCHWSVHAYLPLLTTEQRAFVKRYYLVPGVHVIEKGIMPIKDVCSALPFPDKNHWYSCVKNAWFDLLKFK